MNCIYWKSLNGVNGECTVNPPVWYDGDKYHHPIILQGCHCRFYAEEYPSVKPDDKQTARQALLVKKKAEQEKLKNK